MKTTATPAPFQIRKALDRAAKAANKFVTARDMFVNRAEKKRAIVENKLDGDVSISMKYLFPLIFIAVAALMYWGLKTTEMMISGILDPEADQNKGYVIVALGLSIVQLKIGDILMHPKRKVDQYSGIATFNNSFWFAILGAVLMLTFIYLIARVAVQGSPSLALLPYIALAISAIELVFGGLMLEKAFVYAHLALMTLLMWFDHRIMRSEARETHERYGMYRSLQTQIPNAPLEGSNNIRQALLYYNENEGVADNTKVRLELRENLQDDSNDSASVSAYKRDEAQPEPQAPDEKSVEVAQDLADLIQEENVDQQNTVYTNDPKNNLTL